MVKVGLTSPILQAARERAAVQQVYDYSHRGEDANAVGCIGEEVAVRWLGLHGIVFADERECTTHDFRFANGRTLDVKTKDRTVIPRGDHDCSVPLYNYRHQKPDYYLFVSLLRNKGYHDQAAFERFTDAYIVGALNHAQLEVRGIRWDAGETDKRNHTTFWTACLNVEVRRLVTPPEAATTWLTFNTPT